jgi:hypothetical protein
MDVNSINNNTISNMSSTVTYVITTIISILFLVIANVVVYSKSFKMNMDDDQKTIFKIIALIIGLILFLIFCIAMITPGGRSATYGFFGKLVQYAKMFMQSIQPIFKSLGSFQNIIMLFGFLFGLIIIFYMLPKDYVNDYSYIILPIIIPVALVMIYISFTTKLNNQQQNNQGPGSGSGSGSPMDFIHLARIHYSLLFIAIITFMSIIYVNNPGGFITKYLWVGIIYSVALLTLAIVYLRNVMFTKDPNKEDPPENQNIPFWQKINPFLSFDVILLIFSLTFLVPLLTNGDVLVNKTIKNTGIIIISILFFIFWTISFVKSLFLLKTTDVSFIAKMKENVDNYSKNLTKYLFLVLLGFVAIATILYWILVFYQHALTTTNIGNIIIYTIVILIILVLVYKLVVTTSVYKDSPLFQLIFNAVFYIPCILVALIDYITHLIPKNKVTNSVASGFASGISNIKKSVSAPTPPIYYGVLAFSILLFVGYIVAPPLLKNLSQQGGKILVNRPIEIQNATGLGSYYQLNNNVDNHTYQYALSFWFYIDSANPGTRSSYERFTNILDYGGKPKVTYNAALNTLRVTMYVGPGGKENNDTNTYSPDLPRKKLDTNGNLIIYELKDVKLQRWNNVIINYTGGTMDIFYNGDLAKSIIGVIPYFNNTISQPATDPTNTATTTTEEPTESGYINYDNLIVGQDGGLYGQICNVNYFKTSLNIYQINYLYKSVKDYSPPALATDNRIIKLDANLGLGTGNILGESTIMGDLPEGSKDTAPVEIQKTPSEMAAATASGSHDFFSLRWYFNANHDIYN